MLISVVLPAYNVQDTIGESIDSILSQTFTDFELIIINDGSQDNTEEVIHAYSDKRIRYYRNEKNEGLIYTLNRGLDLAQGKYIARMDADDVSLPTRFEKQVKVMEESPNIVVCGTQIIPFGVDTAKRFSLFLPEESEDLKNLLFIQTCFAHPTVMVRRQVLIDNEVRYDADYPHAEDYKMWIDLSLLGEFYNIQEPLLKYRLSDGQVSHKFSDVQKRTASACRRCLISARFKDEKLDRQIENNINISTICYIKKKECPRELLEVLYFSLKKYEFKSLCYLFISGDIFRFEIVVALALLKRFIVKKDSLLWMC